MSAHPDDFSEDGLNPEDEETTHQDGNIIPNKPDTISAIELDEKVRLLRFEPPRAELPDLARIGVRTDKKSTYLVLWDSKARRLVELDLASPRKSSAQLARYFGNIFPAAFVHDHAMKLARGARDLRDIQRIKDGITVTGDDRALIVSETATISVQVARSQPIFHDELLPIVDDHYLADPHRQDWLGFTADGLNKPSLYSLRETFEHIFNIVSCFDWTDLADVYLHALLPFYSYIHTLWPTKILVSMSGPESQTMGFLEALYINVTEADAPVVPTVVVEPAAVTTVRAQLPDSGTLPILVMPDGDDFLVPSIYSSSSRSAKERNHPKVPIFSATDQDYDPGRWLPSQIGNNPKRLLPRNHIFRYLKEADVDLRELRRAILIGSLSGLPGAKRAAEGMLTDPPGRVRQLPRALQSSVIQLAAVGEVFGEDGPWIADLLASRILNVRRQEEAKDPGPALLSTLLHGHFNYVEGYVRGMPQRVPTTLATLLQKLNVGAVQEVAVAGCILVRTSKTEGQVYANWAAAAKGPLFGTQYSRMSKAMLSRKSRTAPGWVQNSVQRPFRGVQERFTHFQVPLTVYG
ncbi:MAG: hypothetical protein O2913_13910 [Chloroflexi bacterium]|nr:hypothetical protein [Chloroflexota bacterium]